MVPMVIQEIRRLNQAEGLTDAEIADQLGISRVTVCRVRKQAKIPRCNRANRKDKSYVCKGKDCGKEVVIARKERKRRYCETCQVSIEMDKQATRHSAAQEREEKYSS